MRRRLTRFVLLLFGIAIAGTEAVTATWLHFVPASGPAWLWWAVPSVLTAGFVPAMLLGFRLRHPLLRAATLVSAIAIGFLSFALVAASLAWIVAAAAAVCSLPLDLRITTASLYALAGVVAVYGLINSVLPRTTRLTVFLPRLPDFWRGKTVALVSDIHLGNIRGAAFSRHLAWRLGRSRPEAIFISGDMFDGTEIDSDRAIAPWSGLGPPSGIHFVTGNHDDRRNRADHLAALSRAGIRVLDNERLVLHGLQLIGIHDAETHTPSRYQTLLARANIDPAAPSILLAHQPINLAIPESAGISLQLAGHTHGGQFWPWSLLARRVHGPYVYGLHRYGRMQIYTSSGAGTWGPPFRVGTRSEIVLLRLEAG